MPQAKTEKPLIALVEDEEVIANLLVAKLEKADYRVKWAKDGEAGLGLIEAEKPDLVLLDMLLPKLNGFAILERLKEKGLLPALPVIVISNSGQPIEMERILQFGVRDYLIKVNFDPDQVLAKVNAVVRSSQKKESPADQRAPQAVLKRVLIVEDDVFLAELLEQKFRQKGYALARAPDVEQARRALAEHPIDIILLDIVLPGMNGLVFLEELKAQERFKTIPVVIISNLGQQEEIERGLKAGARDYIVKANVTPGEILEKVEAILKK